MPDSAENNKSELWGTMEQRNEEQLFQEIYGFLRKCMKLSGLYNTSSKNNRKKSTRFGNIVNFANVVLSFVVNCVLLFNIVRMVYMVQRQRTDGVSTTLMVSYAAMSCLVSEFYCSILNFFFTASKFDAMLDELNHYGKRFGTSNCLKTISKRLRITALVAYVVVAAVVATHLLFMFALKRYSKMFHTIIVLIAHEHSSETFSSVLLAFALSFGVLQQCSQTLFLHMTNHLLVKELKDVTDYLASYNEDKQKSCEKLSTTRLRFEHLVNIVNKFDACINHFIGVAYPNGIMVVCLTLYGVFVDNLPPADLMLVVLFLISAFALMFSVTMCGIVLTGKIHSPLDHLHSIDLTELSDREVHEVTVFIARLSGPTIGLTFYGLFTIDRSTILMVLGTILTYAILIIQLKPDGRVDAVKDVLKSMNCSVNG